MQQSVWIYQSDKTLSAEESQYISEQMSAFFAEWHAHGKSLTARSQILHNLFLIIEIDPAIASASGCSIDACVNFLKKLEDGQQFTFFDRNQVACRINGEVTGLSTGELNEMYRSGIITGQTIVFNTLVSSHKELQENWELPLANSWHNRLVQG